MADFEMLLVIFVFVFCRQKLQEKTNQNIELTSKQLQRLTVVVRHGDKQQKLHVEKLTSDFKKIVQMYSTSQQVIFFYVPFMHIAKKNI